MQKPPARSLYGAVIAVCMGVFLWAQSVGYTVSVEAGALYGPYVTNGEWWRLFTSGFMHANLLHITMNMLSLWVLGRLLEPLYDTGGRWRFPVLYVVSLLGGGVGALLLEYDTPVIGASGAVFGLLGAAIALPWRLGSGANRFGVLPWLGLNLLLTFAVPGISAGGHLGGLVAGFVAGWLLAPVSRLHDTTRHMQ